MGGFGRQLREVGSCLALGVGVGLVAGYLDVLALTVRRILVEPLVFVGRDIWWTAPVANAFLFFAIALVAGAVAMVFPRLPVWRLLLWVLVALSVFGALYTYPQIHRVAALVMSLGVASAGLRWVASRESRVRSLIGPASLLLLTATGLIAAGFRVRAALHERRAVAGLPAAAPGTPNVLLIVLDTVRALNLSLYGYPRETTPLLTRRAATGVVFTRAYATAPWTLPSHASMLTGRWMHELSADWMVPLDAQFPTLAEVLGAVGYRTGGFVANTDYCSYEVGLDRGFAHFEDYTLDPGQVLRSSAIWRAIARVQPLRDLIGHHDGLGRRTGPEISSAFLRWASRDPRRPFFAFLNYYDAHRPYLPPEPFANRFRTPGVALNPRVIKENGREPDPVPERVQGAIDAYDNAIAYLDHELERLFAELERRGLLRNTVVVLTSDHGEEFVEHGAWDHGNTLYQPSVHVPLVLWWPDGPVPTGGEITEPVSLRDLPATLTDLLGVTSPFPGRSLARRWAAGAGQAPADSILIGVRQVPRQPFWYPVSRGNLASVVVGDLRYLRNFGDGAEELYDAVGDPLEARNLADTPLGIRVIPSFRTLTDSLFPPPR